MENKISGVAILSSCMFDWEGGLIDFNIRKAAHGCMVYSEETILGHYFKTAILTAKSQALIEGPIEIEVTIKFEHVDGLSIGAAALAALITYKCGYEYDGCIVVSGVLKEDGSIGGVADAAEKVETAWKAGSSVIILPEDNRWEYTTPPHFSVLYVDSVECLYKTLKLLRVKEYADRL